MFYRLGRAAARFRFLILGGWLVLVLACLPFAPRVAGVLSPGGFTSSGMQSQQALTALQTRLHSNFTFVQVIFTSNTLSAGDPRFVQEATQAVADLSHAPGVTSTREIGPSVAVRAGLPMEVRGADRPDHRGRNEVA